MGTLGADTTFDDELFHVDRGLPLNCDGCSKAQLLVMFHDLRLDVSRDGGCCGDEDPEVLLSSHTGHSGHVGRVV